MKSRNWFIRFSQSVSYMTGHPVVFFGAMMVVIIWGLSGPLFDFNNTWQLVINTGTTIITFLMVFLIQSTQNRDTAAMQLKLDELIRATEGAHTVLLDLEELSEADLEHIRRQYEKIAADARRKIKSEKPDTGVPFINIKEISNHG